MLDILDLQGFNVAVELCGIRFAARAWPTHGSYRRRV
jgi:hypothetical protein